MARSFACNPALLRIAFPGKLKLIAMIGLAILICEVPFALRPMPVSAQAANQTQTEKDRVMEEARKLDAEIRRLYRADKEEEARPLAERLLAIREQALGPDHPDVAESLGILAVLYRSLGEYAKAEPLLRRALAMTEKRQGPEHSDVARPLNSLGGLYAESGQYAKAEPFFLRALAIREKTLAPDDPTLADTINNLALFYNDKGDYLKAELFSERGLALLEKTAGPEHPKVANALTNFAILYHRKGDFVRAESLHLRALAIREKAFGREHSEVAASLNNLAAVYRNKEEYIKAELHYQRALAIWEKLRGPDHPELANAVLNLAVIYDLRGDFARAETFYQRALAIWEKTLGPEHLKVAEALGNYANLLNKKADYAKAEALYQRALAIREKIQGAEHPDLPETLNNLAILHNTKGNLAEAIAYQSRAVAVSELNVALNIAAGSERQKLAYLTKLTLESNHAISLHLQSAPNDAATRDLALKLILLRKGRALDAMTDSLSTLRRHATPQSRALFNQLEEANTQLARLVFGGPGRNSPEEHRKQIKLSTERKEKLEDDIGRQSSEFKSQAQPVTPASVQAAIPPGAALVEFISYRPFNTKYRKAEDALRQPRYAAYVLRRQGEVRWVELGEAKAINQAVDELRQALRKLNAERLPAVPEKEVKRLARAVDEAVMRPVRKLLGDARQVLISPDGDLNLIPFAALVDEAGRYLAEAYSLSYLTSGRDLLRLQVARESKSNPLVVADPVYGEKSSAKATAEQSSRSDDPLAKINFNPLLTGPEADAIKRLMPDAKVLTREKATEAAVKQVHAPRILHIATHGFFLQSPDAVDAGGGNTRGISLLGLPPTRSVAGGDAIAGQIENPLLRAGLALAGANKRQDADDDGILTALEVAGLDLWGTKLVVLSACDTGVGEVKNGEGVYGMRRALVLAGAESQVVSLWKVDDAATKDLMVAYYKELMKGTGRAEALRKVQQAMLGDPKRRHPYYWASFIHSGEWANLAGQR